MVVMKKIDKELRKAGITNSPGYNPKKDKYLNMYYKKIKKEKKKIRKFKYATFWFSFSLFLFVGVYVSIYYIKYLW